MSEDAMVTRTGGCLCGAVRYEVVGEPFFVAQCCCEDCQKSSGTGHITAAFFPADHFSISGETTEYSKTADSGNIITRLFCPTCGSRLFGRSTGRDGVMSVMAGTLDNGNGLKPKLAIYTRSRNDWDFVDPDLPHFEGAPPKR